MITKSYKVPTSNGFGRMFNKVMTDAPTDDILGAFQRRDHMMGHRGFVRLDQHYHLADPMELAAQYLRAVPGPDRDQLRSPEN